VRPLSRIPIEPICLDLWALRAEEAPRVRFRSSSAAPTDRVYHPAGSFVGTNHPNPPGRATLERIMVDAPEVAVVVVGERQLGAASRTFVSTHGPNSGSYWE
jgi:hypothetical protein